MQALGGGIQRTDRFAVSRRPYAIKLDSFRVGGAGFCEVDAAWFRRRNRQTVACVGRLWGPFERGVDPVEDVRAWLDQLDGRYGGDCLARWDGTGLWTCCNWQTSQRHKEFLASTLDAYPAIPDGYDGWWEFRR